MRKTKKLAFIFIVAAGCIVGLFTLKASGITYTSCVKEANCVGNSPTGRSCMTLFSDEGSQPQSGGVQASSSYCAYIYAAGNPGTPCGAAIPAAPADHSCN
jgi:hypothetical protein